MSIWISSAKAAFAIILVLPLAGCLDDGTGTFGIAEQPGSEAMETKVLRQVSLFGGDVVVAGPAGYCIDAQSLRRNAGGSFVLLASCESLTGKRGEVVVEPAVMTVSVLRAQQLADQPTTVDLAELADGGRILAAEDGDGVSLVHLSSGGDTYLPDGDPRHWRGGMLINGHVVGIAVYGPKDEAAAGRYGRQILVALAETLRQLSPVR
jgi:hypothetical protein